MVRKSKPRNAGTWTEARYMSQIRSHLRAAFRYWLPIKKAKEAARRHNQSENKRMKWEYRCKHCNRWFPEKLVQVDHVVPCGRLKELGDVPFFIMNLTEEDYKEGYQVLCKECHKKVTAAERKAPVTQEYWEDRIRWHQKEIEKCERELREMHNKAQRKEE